MVNLILHRIVGLPDASFKRPLLSVDVFVGLCVGNLTLNVSETKRFTGSCPTATYAGKCLRRVDWCRNRWRHEIVWRHNRDLKVVAFGN